MFMACLLWLCMHCKVIDLVSSKIEILTHLNSLDPQ